MEVRSGWATIYNVRVPSLQNVVPEDDVIDHQLSIKCPCRPHYERIRSGPHVLGRIVVHNQIG